MHSIPYILRCLSPLHAGSGDTTTGVIDNRVQRDATTQFPVVHSSSFKGALREHFVFLDEQQKLDDPQLVSKIFGAGTQLRSSQAQPFAAGQVAFEQAYLLSLPVRSDKVPYFLVSTREILLGLSERLSIHLGEKAKTIRQALQVLIDLSDEELVRPRVFRSQYDGAVLEEESYQGAMINLEEKEGAGISSQKAWREQVEPILGAPFAIMNHEMFQELARDLPVIARNELKNGESKNLWYEEIVPREARFYAFVHGPKELCQTFDGHLRKQVVQLGANASIGYGQTLFNSLSTQ